MSAADRLETPRPVAHEVSFADERTARRAIAVLEGLGFAIEGQQHRGSHLIWFSRDSALTDEVFLEELRAAIDATEAVEGRYERWVAPIVPGAADRPLAPVTLPVQLAPQSLPSNRAADYSTQDLATMWLANDQTGGDILPFADLLWPLTHDDPHRAIDVVIEVLSRLDVSVHQRVAFSLAAGPLEDALRDSGPEIIDVVIDEAVRNPPFAYILGGVWSRSFDKGVRARLWGLTDQF